MCKSMRIFCMLLALLLLVIPPIQVRADVPYYPDEPHDLTEGDGDPVLPPSDIEPSVPEETKGNSGGSGAEDNRVMIATVMVWILVVILATVVLLMLLKRRR